jgi:hypothetical protein
MSPLDEGEIDLARLRRVIEIAAKRGGWSGGRQDGVGHGFAAVCWFPTYVAQMATVEVNEGRVRPRRVVCAIDYGRVVHPDIVRAQVEGGIAFALGAVHAATRFHDREHRGELLPLHGREQVLQTGSTRERSRSRPGGTPTTRSNQASTPSGCSGMRKRAAADGSSRSGSARV